MSCYTDLAGNSYCGFHYSGLPCPLEASTKQLTTPYTAAFDTVLFQSLRLRNEAAPQFIREVPPDCPFLALPGEIRNRIYRFVLVAERPFTVQLQWTRTLDAALLWVNKQVFEEASSIFYAENAFRFSEALFVGAPILQQLQTLYRIPRLRLKMLRNIILDVPVYGRSNFRCCLQTAFNLRHLTELLASSPKTRVLLQFGYVWVEDGCHLGPKDYLYLLSTGTRSLRLSGAEIDVHIKTHPRFLDEWVDLLVST